MLVDPLAADNRKHTRADAGSGTAAAATHTVGTIAEALALVAALYSPTQPKTIVLKPGMHYLNATMALGPEHSNLTIMSTPGAERAWISGGILLQQKDLKWKKSDASKATATATPTPTNNIWAATIPDHAAAAAASSLSGSMHWESDAGAFTPLTKARFPNRRPEDGTMDKGSLLDLSSSDVKWERKPGMPKVAAHVNVSSPSVPLSVTTEFNHWMGGVGGECDRFDPPVGYICNPNVTGGGYDWEGPGPFWPFSLKFGKNLTTLFPNAGEWGDRGDDMSQAIFTTWTNGWFTTHFDVTSWNQTGSKQLVFGSKGGNQGGRGWHFDLEQENNDPATIELCTGNVRGSDCGPVKIEGLLAELDAPNEFFVDKQSRTLHLYYNATAPNTPPSAAGAGTNLIVPALQTLVHLEGQGVGPAVAHPESSIKPVVNVTFLNVGFRDAAQTVMEAHGLPSAGDWALQRTAAVMLEGTEHVKFDGCKFKYLGGIAYMLSGYNRQSRVDRSEFAHIGGSAMAAWGYTRSIPGSVYEQVIPAGDGIDGTAGNYPEGSVVHQTVCREIGTVEKQSSCWFQAKSAKSTITNNVFYNGPRALINMNDGFGGGNLIRGNALFNGCRESGDHGQINTWDRNPYLTTVRSSVAAASAAAEGRATTAILEASLFPAYNNVSRNMFISNYNSFDGIDNDDGSSYYDIGHNVFYEGEGLKSDYRGHGKIYHHNLNVGAGVCCFQFGFISGRDAGSNVAGHEFYKKGHTDVCHSNKCVQRKGGSWCNGAHVIIWGCNASLAGCAPDGAAPMTIYNNSLYQETGRTCPYGAGSCDVACGMGSGKVNYLSKLQFAKKCGPAATDSAPQPLPSTATLVGWAEELLLTQGG